jgi:hypothetical protein
MNLVNAGIKWTAGLLAAIVGGLVAIAVVVALITQSIPTGAKASLSLAHYGVVMTGAILSYADNVGPDLQNGKAIGDKATPKDTKSN